MLTYWWHLSGNMCVLVEALYIICVCVCACMCAYTGTSLVLCGYVLLNCCMCTYNFVWITLSWHKYFQQEVLLAWCSTGGCPDDLQLVYMYM